MLKFSRCFFSGKGVRVWSFVLIVVLSLFMLRVVLCAHAAAGQDANAHFVMERRKLMYSPLLNENLVRTIYRIKRVWKKPMTEIAESLIQQSLKAVDKNAVCEICIGEKNNECENCYLKKGGS